MSSNVSASFGANANAASARAPENTRASFWRRLFDAWVQSYANHLDPDGNVMWEL